MGIITFLFFFFIIYPPKCPPENHESKFWLGRLVTKEDGKIKPKKKSCQWLKEEATPHKVKKFCSQTESYEYPFWEGRTIPPASKLCTETCNSCPSFQYM